MNQEALRCTQCIRNRLGDKIDLKWDMETAVLEVSPSKSAHFVHASTETSDVFLGVPFYHSETCPFLNETLQANY